MTNVKAGENIDRSLLIEGYLGIVVDSHSGGIWILWNPIICNMESIKINPRVIHAAMSLRNSHKAWVLIDIYVPLNPRKHKRVFDKVVGLAQ